MNFKRELPVIYFPCAICTFVHILACVLCAFAPRFRFDPSEPGGLFLVNKLPAFLQGLHDGDFSLHCVLIVLEENHLADP